MEENSKKMEKKMDSTKEDLHKTMDSTTEEYSKERKEDQPSLKENLNEIKSLTNNKIKGVYNLSLIHI